MLEKNMIPFIQYVNERNDIGMDAWMRENLSEEDYAYYCGQAKKRKL